ncbi:MAG TPA: FAD:protein FMN transferase [Longimicrobiales bacterium]|nr:FAD:protein FMN transferase [Longimicrobiales bacterium]
MGTLLRIRISDVDRGCGTEAIEAAIAEVERLEGVLSSWVAESEIGRLNAAQPGAQVELTAELYDLLAEAGIWVEETGRAFDPAVGALIDTWELRGQGRVPSAADLARARAASGWSRVTLEEGNRVTRGPSGWWLDTGGFGKGAALRAAARVLASRGVVFGVLDFGGQLLVLGEAEAGVAHPSKRDREVVRLKVAGSSVATTSSSERFVSVKGRRLGHVLDPRRGEPVPAWGSVTVVMQDALSADALSTALFVMGADAALEWAAQRQDVGVLVLRLDGGSVSAGCNASMATLISSVSAEVGHARCEFTMINPEQGN